MATDQYVHQLMRAYSTYDDFQQNPGAYVSQILKLVEEADKRDMAPLLQADNPQWDDPEFFAKVFEPRGYDSSPEETERQIRGIRERNAYPLDKLKGYVISEYYVRKLFRRAVKERNEWLLGEVFPDLVYTLEGILTMYMFLLENTEEGQIIVAHMLLDPNGEHVPYYSVLRRRIVGFMYQYMKTGNRATGQELTEESMIGMFDTVYKRAQNYFSTKSIGKHHRMRRRSPSKNPKCSKRRKSSCKSKSPYCKWIPNKGCRRSHSPRYD